MSDPWPPRPSDEDGRRPPADDWSAQTGDVEPADSGSPRSSANRRALGIAFAAVVLLLAMAALAAGPAVAPGSPTFPPVGASTAPAGAPAASTRAALMAALAAQGLQLEDVVSPYRPAEGPRVAGAARMVVRVIIPDDPEHGRIAIYEFVTPNDAFVAATEQAAYVSSGVGRVQFPTDARFTIRTVGSTVVFFAWTPASSPDRWNERIAETLATVGFEVVVPS